MPSTTPSVQVDVWKKSFSDSGSGSMTANSLNPSLTRSRWFRTSSSDASTASAESVVTYYVLPAMHL